MWEIRSQNFRMPKAKKELIFNQSRNQRVRPFKFMCILHSVWTKNKMRVPLRGKKKRISDFKVVKWFKQLLNTGSPDFLKFNSWEVKGVWLNNSIKLWIWSQFSDKNHILRLKFSPYEYEQSWNLSTLGKFKTKLLQGQD